MTQPHRRPVPGNPGAPDWLTIACRQIRDTAKLIPNLRYRWATVEFDRGKPTITKAGYQAADLHDKPRRKKTG